MADDTNAQALRQPPASARDSFTQGLHLTAVTSAVLVLGTAILVLILLRDVRAGSAPEE